RNMDKFNGIILKNLLEVNYKGKIFLVNPYAEKILGIKCYPHVTNLPEVPELGIILHSNVIPILENCGKAKIKNIMIQTDITLKNDEDPDVLKNKIVEVTSKYKINFIGPSSIGLINFPDNFTTSIIPVRDRIARLGKNKDRAGIGFLAQSGGLAGACGWWNPTQSISFSKVIHVTEDLNGAIDISEFIKYLVRDPWTKVISLFLRQINDSLIKVVREYSHVKPILFKKCGKQQGVDLLKDAGALPVNNYLDLFEVAKAFIFSPLPTGNKIALIGPSSGAIDTVLSEFRKNHLSIAKPTKPVKNAIIKLLNTKRVIRCNPVDYWPPPRFFGHEVGRVHQKAADLLLSDRNVDALFLVLEFFHEIEFDLMNFSEIVKKYPNKPIMGVLIQAEEDGAKRMRIAATELGIPLYNEPERLVHAYKIMLDFFKHVSRKKLTSEMKKKS
ncbi:MAG: CoA-binding protein, partial [Promethearchaeota archaeon]